MEKKTISAELITNFKEHLILEERSKATVEKYIRDVRCFAAYVGNAEITKETVIAYKNKLLYENYAARSINSMLASINGLFSFLGWADLKVKSIKLQRQIYCPEEKELTKAEYTLASSLNDKWHCIKMTFDDDIRCHHQNIPAEIAEDAEFGTDKIIDGRVLSVSLQGQRFSADRYLILYRDARIDNVNDILKLKKRRKKNIQMIFRPANGKNFFYKYCKFEGIRHISDETIYK